MSPGVAKKQFSVGSPSASRPSFESALDNSFEKPAVRRSGRDCRNAPVFKGIINSNLIIFMYRLHAFEIWY